MANGVHVFIDDGDVIGSLEDLKRIGHVSDPWDARHQTLRFWVLRRTFFEIFRLLLQRPRLIRNFVPFHHALAGWYASPRMVVLDIPRRRIHYLPDTR